VSKSLQRQAGVDKAKSDLDTQSSTVTFKKGKVIDFAKLAKAVDKAGFTAGEITIWATGSVETSDGQVVFKVSDSHQTFPLVENEQAVKLKAARGKEVKIVGKVMFQERPPRLVVERFQM